MAEETKEKNKVQREIALEGRVLKAVSEKEVREKGLKEVGDFPCINNLHCSLGINKRFKDKEEIKYYNADYIEKGKIVLYSD
jgi:hypothetical protein